MIEFQVDDMTCGHCAGVITKAVKSVDAAAQIDIDVPGKRVRVHAAAQAQEIETAIREAGYTPVRVGASA